MRRPRTIIAGIGLAVMAVGGVTAVSAGGSPASSAPSAGTAAATVRTAPAAVGRSTEAILVKARAAAASTPGTLDTTFGTGGQASVEFFAPPMQGAQEFARAVLVQPDGKILVAGSARQGQIRFAPIQGALARFNANGTLDTSFGTGGKILSSSLPNGITAVGLDAAGNIFTLPIRAEFSPTGQADAGVTPAAITASSQGGSSAFLPSGQFIRANGVTVAKHDNDIQVQRFNADGSTASASPAFDYSARPAWTRR
jgi:uncharacterized delta-60 repeat protein